MNGRPLALQWEHENIPAIVEGWHLGIQMGNAIAHVLSGTKNPEGKLSSSFPAVTGQCPVYYNHPNTGRPAGSFKFTSRYLDAPFGALYPFGYGLHYTEFEFNEISARENGDAVEVTLNVKNTGDRSGTETVQFYIQDVTASIVRPVKELKGFRKISLEPGEARTVSCRIPKNTMGFWNNKGHYVMEDGLFKIFAGPDSENVICTELEVGFDGVDGQKDYI